MRRIRWFDPEPDDPSTPIDWRAAAAILATLFLNISFWLGVAGRVWMVWSLPTFALILAAGVVLTTAISVGGPWLAACEGRRRLFDLMEHSLGSLAARLMLWIGVGYAIAWLAVCLSIPVRLWFFFRETPTWHAYGMTAVLLAFLIYTGLQSLTTEAKLGLFTSKLCVALLVAALWRVRDGWPAIPAGFQESSVSVLWSGFSELTAYVIPFGLLAADLASRIRNRREASSAATAGIAVPLFASVLLTGIIAVATHKSSHYQPSLNPNVAMALFGGVASSALPGRWAIVAITVFGLARFCIRSISAAAPIKSAKWKWVALMLLCTGTSWLAMHPFAPSVEKAMGFLGSCLGVTSAIVTADWLMRHRAAPRRVDLTGCAAFLIGLALPWRLPHERIELLPCYVVAFVACIAGRTLERAIRP